MSFEVKLIAHYLPQYHRIPENDKWWGSGYTDWEAVKRAKPQFEGHQQPKIPMDNNYYDLSRKSDIEWQINIAKKYGVYGFDIYHYWFNSSLHLLGTPAQIILDNPEYDIHYMFNWDNSSWKRTWSAVRNGNSWAPEFDKAFQKVDKEFTCNGVLAPLEYGDNEDWKKHFDYLLPFFKDKRYIKIQGKPLFGIFQTNNNYDLICEMHDCWNDLAKKNGLPGIAFMGKVTYEHLGFEYGFTYEPFQSLTLYEKSKTYIRRHIFNSENKPYFESYRNAWMKTIKRAEKYPNNIFPGACVAFDDTPRRGHNARILTGGGPDEFCEFLSRLIELCKEKKKEFIFLTAWNEWGEGAYLEPDKMMGFKYLETIKYVLEKEKDR